MKTLSKKYFSAKAVNRCLYKIIFIVLSEHNIFCGNSRNIIKCYLLWGWGCMWLK